MRLRIILQCFYGINFKLTPYHILLHFMKSFQNFLNKILEQIRGAVEYAYYGIRRHLNGLLGNNFYEKKYINYGCMKQLKTTFHTQK